MRRLKMQILCPAAPQFRVAAGGRAGFRTRIFRFSVLSALSVAACVPDGVDAEVVDENVQPVDFATAADIVGISFMTYNAPRAYALAARFRGAGKTVFFGGYHPSLLPGEAAGHADAVCIGEAEANLPAMIADFRAGRLKKFYRAVSPELKTLRADPRLLRGGSYMPATVVQATRGCPNHCEFCSIAAFAGYRFEKRAIEEVVEEVRAAGRRRVLFIDDSLAADPGYFKALLAALAPLRIHWYSQISFAVTRDPETLEWMRRSGCRGVFIGFESIAQESLRETGKGFNRAAEYRRGIEELHRRGIAVIAAFVLGHDHDDPAIFDRTLRFLEDARADALQLTVLTPFPGTPLYRRLEREGRIRDRDWTHYDLGHVTFEPAAMSPAELMAGHNRVLARFYSWTAIARRLWRGARYLAPGELSLLALVGWGYRLKLRKDGYLPPR